MLWRFELKKLIRSRRPAIAVAVLVLFIMLMLMGFYTYADNETEGRAQFRYTFENESYFNGLLFALYASYFAMIMVLPIFAVAEGGSQIAPETSGGMIYLLLSRPISRSRLFVTKLAIAAIYLVILVGVFLAMALSTGLIAVGWGELRIYPGVLQLTDTPQFLTQKQTLLAFLLAWPAASVALMAPLTMSFLLSVYMRNPINVVAASVAVYLVLYVTSEVHFFDDLRPYLFTSYIGYWRNLFRNPIDWTMLLRDGAKLFSFTFAFIALAYHRFRVREES